MRGDVGSESEVQLNRALGVWVGGTYGVQVVIILIVSSNILGKLLITRSSHCDKMRYEATVSGG